MAEENKSNKTRQFIAGYGVSMGGFHLGVCLGWSSGGLSLIWKDRGEKPMIDAWIVSIFNLGAVVSLVITAFLLERIGRKWTMVGDVPLFVALWLILTFVRNDADYIVMRFFLGVTAGTFCVVSPVYVGEIAEASVRGSLGVGFQLLVVLGILFTYCMVLVNDWFWFNFANIFPLILFLVWIMFMPETPYFLESKGKTDKARKSLQWLRGKDYKIDNEFNEIAATVQRRQAMEKLKISDLGKQRAIRRAMGVGLLLMSCAQMSGISVVIFNMEIIFAAASAGDEALSPELQSIIVGCVQVAATVVAAVLVDRTGRRLLMMMSMLVMSFFHLGLFIYFLIYDQMGKDTAHSIAWLPILCLTGYIVGFSLGAGPIPWCMMGEIFPDEAKAVSASIAAIYGWFVSFVLTWAFEFLKNVMPMYVFFIFFACVSLLGFVGCYIWLVETKDRSFDEIRELFDGNDPERAPPGYKKTPE